MRRILSCVLMMILPLCACTAAKQENPRQLAAAVRSEYLAMTSWRTRADISALYGDVVFEFSVEAQGEQGGESSVTVTAPESVAGITARIRKGEALLEYDGLGLSLGELDDSGLTPVSALPALLKCLKEGYIADCAWSEAADGRVLLLQCRDPRSDGGAGTGFDLYLDPVSHVPLRAEVSRDGVLVLAIKFDEFTMEMTNDGTGTDEDLGRDRPGSSGA